jgi:hypothetical protein
MERVAEVLLGREAVTTSATRTDAIRNGYFKLWGLN